MINIKFENNINEIYNQIGLQLIGSSSPNMEGLNPKELIEASLGLCISITLKKLLERDNVSLSDISIDIHVEAKKDPDGSNKFSDFNVTVDFPKFMTEDYKKKAMIIIERGCTISNTLKNGSSVTIIEKA